MTDTDYAVNSAPAQHPVGRTQQNDFREQSVSPQAEHSTWEKSNADRTPPVAPTRTSDVGTDEIAFATIDTATGAVLDATHAITPPVRILADDPARRSAQITAFSGTNLYIAHSPGDFQGFDQRVALFGTTATPMPGMIQVTTPTITIRGTREVWGMIIHTANKPEFISVLIERGTRTQS